MAEHECNVIALRTKAGLVSARARGKNGERPAGFLPAYQEIAPTVKSLYEAKEETVAKIMKFFSVGSRRTFYKILAFVDVEVKGFVRKKERKRNKANVKNVNN